MYRGDDGDGMGVLAIPIRPCSLTIRLETGDGAAGLPTGRLDHLTTR